MDLSGAILRLENISLSEDTPSWIKEELLEVIKELKQPSAPAFKTSGFFGKDKSLLFQNHNVMGNLMWNMELI